MDTDKEDFTHMEEYARIVASQMLEVASGIEEGRIKKRCAEPLATEGYVTIRRPGHTRYVPHEESVSYMKNIAESMLKKIEMAGQTYTVGFNQGEPVYYNVSEREVCEAVNADIVTIEDLLAQLKRYYEIP